MDALVSWLKVLVSDWGMWLGIFQFLFGGFIYGLW